MIAHSLGSLSPPSHPLGAGRGRQKEHKVPTLAPKILAVPKKTSTEHHLRPSSLSHLLIAPCLLPSLIQRRESPMFLSRSLSISIALLSFNSSCIWQPRDHRKGNRHRFISPLLFVYALMTALWRRWSPRIRQVFNILIHR